MTAHLLTLLTGALAQNVVFGALIGVESMYLLTRSHQNGTLKLWALLLPLLAAVNLINHLVAQLLSQTHLTPLLPLVITVIAAAGALLLQALFQRFNRRAHEKENGVLFFASITTLFIAVYWWKEPSQSLLTPALSALELWLGFGLGLLCFTSIGAKLHDIAPRSRLAGVALLFLTLALIGLAINGVAGMGR